MSQLIEEPRLFAYLCATFYLGIGFILVKRNRGKPGIDGVSIADFEANLDEELSQLQQELSNWTYQPSPVRPPPVLTSVGFFSVHDKNQTL